MAADRQQLLAFPVPRAVRLQGAAYYALCLALIAAHELLYAQSIGTADHPVAALVLLALLLVLAVIVREFAGRRLYRIPSYTRRRLALITLDLASFLAVAIGLVSIGFAQLDVDASVLVNQAFGVVVVGYFASIDNAIVRQLYWFKNDQIKVEGGFTLVPMAHKFSLVLTFTILVVALTISLSAYRLFGAELDASQVENLPQQFLVEVMFLFSVILALLLRLIHSYTNNIHTFLKAQVEIMKGIQLGELDRRAPIMAQDELGLVAIQINEMVEHLRDRDRLHKTLEKVVGANIMEKLLTTDDETLKRGQEDDVAIMFCDMRDFTSMSEASSSEEIILFLNSFFADLSEIVSRHHGTINKFMGDAILAVYGLEKEGRPVEDAVRSAFEILEHTQQFVLPDGKHPEMGAGIHFGTVVGGTIGSEQRYEYTFLGDAVNTASRLEGLTKRMRYRIIVSLDAYRQLTEVAQHHFVDLGAQRVRGKSEPLHVYGTQRK